MKLYLDTTDKITQIVLVDKGGVIRRDEKYDLRFNQSEELLLKIEEVLQKDKKTIRDVSEIGVNPGPGSYTGQRIGVTVANALAFGLNIPVVAAPNLSEYLAALTTQGFSQPATPVYDKPPFITKPKARL